MIGLREDQRMKARMVNFLNHTASHCRSELVVASKLACAGVRSAPDKAGSSCAVEREQAPSPQQARSYRGLVKPGVGSAESKPAG